jgi:hypothetical protein
MITARMAAKMIASTKWTINAASMMLASNVAGCISASRPRTIAAIIRGGPHGLCPIAHIARSSSTRNTAPATQPPITAARQSGMRRAKWCECM